MLNATGLHSRTLPQPELPCLAVGCQVTSPTRCSSSPLNLPTAPAVASHLSPRSGESTSPCSRTCFRATGSLDPTAYRAAEHCTENRFRVHTIAPFTDIQSRTTRTSLTAAYRPVDGIYPLT